MTRKELRKKRKIKKLRQFLEILVLIIGVLANIVTILEFFGIKPQLGNGDDKSPVSYILTRNGSFYNEKTKLGKGYNKNNLD